MQRTPKIGYIDIETLPMQCTTFSLFPEHLSPKTIRKEGSIVCISVGIKGRGIHTFSVLDDMEAFKKDPYNDRIVLEGYSKFLEKEDFDLLVGHNGDSFDIKTINSRIIKHKMKPLPPIASDDTKKMAKSVFRFHSNKLEHLVKYLGIEAKGETDYGMWLDIIEGKVSAVKEMIAYNRQDVKILEKLHDALLPYCKSKLNLAHFEGKEACPNCGECALQKRGIQVSAANIKQRNHCQACGKWSIGKVIKGQMELPDVPEVQEFTDDLSEEMHYGSVLGEELILNMKHQGK